MLPGGRKELAQPRPCFCISAQAAGQEPAGRFSALGHARKAEICSGFQAGMSARDPKPRRAFEVAEAAHLNHEYGHVVSGVKHRGRGTTALPRHWRALSAFGGATRTSAGASLGTGRRSSNNTDARRRLPVEGFGGLANWAPLSPPEAGFEGRLSIAFHG